MENIISNDTKLIDIFKEEGINTDELIKSLKEIPKSRELEEKIRNLLSLIVSIPISIAMTTIFKFNLNPISLMEVLKIVGIFIFNEVLMFTLSFLLIFLIFSLIDLTISNFGVGIIHSIENCDKILIENTPIINKIQDKHRLNQALFTSLSNQVILFDKNNEDILEGLKLSVPDIKIEAFSRNKEFGNSFSTKKLINYLYSTPDYVKLKKINERLERLLTK